MNQYKEPSFGGKPVTETLDALLAKIERQQTRIDQLEQRLELWPVDPASGQPDRSIKLDESCDGIACRDETIRLLDEQRAKLRADIENRKRAMKAVRQWAQDNLTTRQAAHIWNLLTDDYMNFSGFVRHASDESKQEVFEGVMEMANKAQDEMLGRPNPNTIPWLRSLAEKGGKGGVTNVDARSLGRVADEIERLRDEWYSPEHMNAVQERTIDPLVRLARDAEQILSGFTEADEDVQDWRRRYRSLPILREGDDSFGPATCKHEKQPSHIECRDCGAGCRFGGVLRHEPGCPQLEKDSP